MPAFAQITSRASSIFLALLVAGSCSARVAAEPLAVEVTNASEPVLCAEKDNVTINFASKDVRRLHIEAAHPAYIGSLQRDSFEADWTGCTAPAIPCRARAAAQADHPV